VKKIRQNIRCIWKKEQPHTEDGKYANPAFLHHRKNDCRACECPGNKCQKQIPVQENERVCFTEKNTKNRKCKTEYAEDQQEDAFLDFILFEEHKVESDFG